MSKAEKLINRLKTKPKDFTFDEAAVLLLQLGFTKTKSGKTGGSRIKFIKDGIPVILHKPHPRNILLDYQVKQLIDIINRGDIL